MDDRVVFQPAAGQRMQKGIHKIVAAVRPTLGPRSRGVVLTSYTHPDVPEYLDDAGLIARRIIELADRDEDIGAMLVRKAIWTVREDAGDGAALTAVLFDSIYAEGLKYIASGGSATRLRTSLVTGMDVVLDELTSVTTPIRGRKKLAQFAYGVCQDREMAQLLGEIFDIIGEWGQLDVRKGSGRELEREYVEGMYWESRPFSRNMLAAPDLLRVDLENPAILITNLNIEDLQQLVPFLSMVKQAGIRSLLITAQKLSDAAIGMLLANNIADQLEIVAVETPFGFKSQQQGMMEDLAMLTGGRPIVAASGEGLGHLKPEDLGRARKAWADRSFFGITGGRGDPRALRQHLADLRSAFARAKDASIRQEWRERIGRLTSGSATLWVGAMTEPEINRRKDLAVRTAEALRGACREGVLPGGGVALLGCRPALRRAMIASSDSDEKAAYRILLRAVEEPARTIIANAGWEPAKVMAAINESGSGVGFDVEAGEVADMVQAGILDSAGVIRMAVISAVTTAAATLSLGALVHRTRLKREVTP